jgi:hypothetical protein
MDNKERDLMLGLAKIAYTGKVSRKVSMAFAEENEGQVLTKEHAEEMLREKFRALAPNRKALRRNKNDIFELIEETIDEAFPVRANGIFEKFCEFKNFSNGDKPLFKFPKGKGQIRRFIKRIALGVPMLRVRLDKNSQLMEFFALGGAVYIEWEHYLDGSYDYVDLCNALIDELVNAIYDEIVTALNTAIDGTTFKKTHTETTDAFSVEGMLSLVSYAKSFGVGGATIVGVSAMCSRIKDADFISDVDKADMRERGYIGKFRSADIVCIEQTYDKDGNALFPEDALFVFPSGSRPEDKFVKVGYEGGTEIKEKEQDDRSLTYEVYAKLGVLLGNADGVSVYKKFSE